MDSIKIRKIIPQKICLLSFILLLLNSLSVHAVTETIQYNYDDARQITKATYDDGTIVDYTYDGSGNRIAKTVTFAGSPLNNHPTSPSNLSPADSATGLDWIVTLSWTSSSDPDLGDVVFYDVYLGTTSPPTLYRSGLNSTNFTTLTLEPFTTYYWKIVARDNHNATGEGPVWSFTIEEDVDNDGLINSRDNCPNISNPDQTDSDGDGMGDLCDTCPIDFYNDLDSDGFCANLDNCPTVSNPNQSDSDSDGIGDLCDVCSNDYNNDLDGDGFCGDVDNCPTISNPDQLDTNGDGVGDLCTINHCVSNSTELQQVLTAAKSNNMFDVIMIEQGIYRISENNNNSFSFDSSEAYGLSIKGGYLNGCSERVLSPDNTILDGEAYLKRVLKINIKVYPAREFTGDIIIEGITVKRGGDGGIYAYIYVPDYKVDVVLNRNILSNNNISGYGSGGSGGGAYLKVVFNGDIILDGNIISGNTSLSGGGGVLADSANKGDVILSNNFIDMNSNSNNKGGGVYINGYNKNCKAVLFNNMITRNTHTGNGAYNYGGGLSIQADNITLTNNTITGNMANQPGGGIVLSAYSSGVYDIFNNIIWGNSASSGGDIYIYSSNSVIKNVYNNNFDPSKVAGNPFTNQANNVNLDPLFIDSANGNFHLTQNSPLINIGNNIAPSLPATDFEGDSRIVGGIVDIGADEMDLNNSPVANPGSPYTGIEGQIIILDGSGSNDSDGSIVLYEWDIDNNGTYEYSSSLSIQNHTYPQQGTYNIKLRVTDNLGATGVATTTATISDTSPTANFTATPTTGPAPLTVNFTSNSTGYDLPLSYTWDFDNNGIIDSTLQNPSAIYTGQGTYTVTLTVTDSDGSTNSLTRTNYITVTPPVYTLTVTKAGSGTGTVTSSPSGINCGTDCTETYNNGTSVTLTAISDAGFVFTGWSGGGCSGTGNCTITMNANTTVTATFNVCSNLLVRIGSTYYSSLQTAYNAASDGAIIQSQATSFTENLNINRSISVTLDGGYDCNYTSKTGTTRLKGMMTISSGRLIAKDVILEK